MVTMKTDENKGNPLITMVTYPVTNGIRKGFKLRCGIINRIENL
jgi:hypothetical protein